MGIALIVSDEKNGIVWILGRTGEEGNYFTAATSGGGAGFSDCARKRRPGDVRAGSLGSRPRKGGEEEKRWKLDIANMAEREGGEQRQGGGRRWEHKEEGSRRQDHWEEMATVTGIGVGHP